MGKAAGRLLWCLSGWGPNFAHCADIKIRESKSCCDSLMVSDLLVLCYVQTFSWSFPMFPTRFFLRDSPWFFVVIGIWFPTKLKGSTVCVLSYMKILTLKILLVRLLFSAFTQYLTFILLYSLGLNEIFLSGLAVTGIIKTLPQVMPLFSCGRKAFYTSAIHGKFHQNENSISIMWRNSCGRSLMHVRNSVRFPVSFAFFSSSTYCLGKH
jgi:hypothetical protein